jgi:adenylate cyclase
VKFLREREFVVNRSARAMLTVGTLVPSNLGASIIGVMTSRGLPTGAALGDPTALRTNIIAAAVYCAVVVPMAALWGLWCTTSRSDASPAERHTLLMRIPACLTAGNAAVWTGAVVLLVLVNSARPWLATTLGVSTLSGATVTATLTYWWCTRVLRPHVAPVLTENPPVQQQRLGLRMRALAAWVVGTGVPLLMVLLAAASALVVDYPGDRLAVVVLGLGGAALLSGLVVTLFTGATMADPIDEVRAGMRRVGRGEYDVTVPVFDASELGLLQAGFNSMAEGLRERERLRDLFGRHVGRDVARLAEAGGAPAMGGATHDVAVMFVDLVGSTRMATKMSPPDLVALLNDFFAVVVEIVERHRGWVNKFQGDAVLAIFGAPQALDDHAGAALAAARELSDALSEGGLQLAAGIGVSAGPAVAGNVGDPRRYEYTVIGDPVNEAARLSEFAKSSGGVAASGSALSAADAAESARWRIVSAEVLRGRDTPTDIAIPAASS